MKIIETKPITIASEFFNKTVGELDSKYFPDVRYYRDNKGTTVIHSATELFNNGCSTYSQLIKKIAGACKDTNMNIHIIVSKHIADFGDTNLNFIYS